MNIVKALLAFVCIVIWAYLAQLIGIPEPWNSGVAALFVMANAPELFQ